MFYTVGGCVKGSRSREPARQCERWLKERKGLEARSETISDKQKRRENVGEERKTSTGVKEGPGIRQGEMGCWCKVRLTGQCHAWK
jgi:hypothetical protein